MNTKKLFAFVMLAMLIAVSGSAVALEGDIDFVKLDGDELYPGTSSIMDYSRDDSYEIKVKVTALEDVKNAEIEAVIVAQDEDDRVSDVTNTFNLDAGNSVIKKLTLDVNHKIDADRYTLRVYFRPGQGDEVVQTYTLNLKQIKHNIVIEEFDIDPSYSVEAGRSVRALVDIENFGGKDEDDVKVEVSIPALGVKALPDYLDIESDESKSSEELYLRIPQCAAPGEYDVVATVTYDDGDEKTTLVRTIQVTDGSTCSAVPVDNSNTGSNTNTDAKPVISVGSQSQDVVAGEGGAIYPVTFTNPTSTAKTFIVGVEGADSFATVRMSPSNTVTINAKDSQTVYVYLAANEKAQEGAHSFVVSVKDASGEQVTSLSLSANVLEGQSSGSVKKVLESVLIVLIVVLVVLALIIAFKKAKKEGDNDEDSDDDYVAQTYY